MISQVLMVLQQGNDSSITTTSGEKRAIDGSENYQKSKTNIVSEIEINYRS
jgi:hypothetical protein